MSIESSELKKMEEDANNAVRVAVTATAATGAIPIPIADMPLMIGEQVTLMAAICKIFQIDIEKDAIKALVLSAFCTGGAAAVGKTVFSSVMKLIPGAGSIAGGAVSATVGGVVTYAMGHAFIDVCKMIKLGKLNVDEVGSSKGKELMKEGYKKYFKKRKEYVENGGK